jgi:hypothetical protein
MTTDDFAGGASAPADTSTAAPEASVDLRSAIDRAFETIEASEGGNDAHEPDTPTIAEAPTDGSRERNPDGTFKAKEQGAETVTEQQKPVDDKPTTDAADAPPGFDPEAKAAWAATPEPVKGAVNRRFRELEAGITQYKGDATRFHSVYRPFDELAARSNIDPVQALQGYVDIDIMLAKDFGAGIDMIFKRAGTDPKAWAAQIMGQAQPEGGAQAPHKDAEIAALRREIDGLKQGFGGINKTIEQQRTDQIGGQLTSYIGSLPEADRTLFKELDGDIAAILSSNPQITLTDAFAKAKGDAQAKYQRMFGGAPSNGVPNALTTTAPPQTRTPGTGGSNPRKGQLSVTGAPGPGQSADPRRVPSSPREALDNAFSTLGL